MIYVVFSTLPAFSSFCLIVATHMTDRGEIGTVNHIVGAKFHLDQQLQV